jgi:hypothetical protein
MDIEIIFARTRWKYDSYVDYWDLVELSGFPVVWLDEMDLSRSDAAYIVSPMNGEFLPYMEQHRDRASNVFLWNLERPGGSGGLEEYMHSNREYMYAGHLDDVIVSDRQLADATGFKFMPLGSHEQLGEPGSLEDRLLGYDLIHLCCYSNHRAWMFRTPSDPHRVLEKLTVARNAWGRIRHLSLQQSRYMLNVHQDEFQYIEPLRFSLAAAYGLPIISEQCYDIYPYSSAVYKADNIRALLGAEWVRDMEYYRHAYRLGLEMRDTMTTQYSFRNCLEKYLCT